MAFNRLARQRQTIIADAEKALARPITGQRAAAVANRRIDKLLRSIRNERHEQGIITDPLGRVLWRGTSGHESQIAFPGAELGAEGMTKHWRGAIVMHQHPKPGSTAGEALSEGLSEPDLLNAASRQVAAAVVVYFRDGGWWKQTVRAPSRQGGWSSVDPRALAQRMYDLWSRAEVHALESDGVPVDGSHLVLQQLRAEGLIGYTRERLE